MNALATLDIPHNTEAEQQFLGALLVNNQLHAQIANKIDASDFFEPVHADIFSAISSRIEADELASPVTLKVAMQHHEGLRELGGPAYLARMAGASISAQHIGDYADLIRDASSRRALMSMLSEASARLRMGSDTPGDVTADLETALASMAPTRSRAKPMSMMLATTSAIEQVDDAYHGRQMPSVPVPWGPLWRVVPSFRAGDMVVIGGRPSMGKSACALSIATHAARLGHPVVFASFEMTAVDVALRAVSEATSLSGNAVPYQSMGSSDLDEAHFRQAVMSASPVSELPIQFLTEDFRKSGSLLAGTKQALRLMGDCGGKTPLIVVDYIQLMEGNGRSPYEQVTDISKQLKHLAKSIGGAVIALSQLSRQVESRDDKRPKLSDLRESGQIEQDADTIIFAYRDEYYLEREKPDDTNLDQLADWQDRMERAHGRMELIVAKQRRGPIGTAHLRCALQFNRIWEA